MDWKPIERQNTATVKILGFFTGSILNVGLKLHRIYYQIKMLFQKEIIYDAIGHGFHKHNGMYFIKLKVLSLDGLKSVSNLWTVQYLFFIHIFNTNKCTYKSIRNLYCFLFAPTRMPKRVMREKTYTRRKRGRPKVRWLDDIQEDIERWGLKDGEGKLRIETGGGE